MTFLLNELVKTSKKTYIPGTPGVSGSPGSPAIPASSSTTSVATPGATFYSSLPPEGFGNYIYLDETGTTFIAAGGFRHFNGVKAIASGIIDNGQNVDPTYIYTAPTTYTYTTTIIPGVAAVPPIAAIPPTAAQFNEDMLLGWNAGATGPATFALDQAIKWVFLPGTVGAVVGVSRRILPQDQGYRSMPIAVMGTSGLYTIYEYGVPKTAPRVFTENTRFSITHETGGILSAIVDGAVMLSVTPLGDLITDGSLYSAFDVIWDALELTKNADGTWSADGSAGGELLSAVGGPSGSGEAVITDAGGTLSDPADILITGFFPAGSVITIVYETDAGGTSTVVVTVTADSTAEDVAVIIAALLDAQPDINAVAIGGGGIEVLPAGTATIVTIISIETSGMGSGVGGFSRSAAVAVATVTPTLGAGSALGLAAASTQSNAVVGSVLVNGTILAWANGSTLSDTQGDAYPIPTLGTGTALGDAGASSISETALTNAYGTGAGGTGTSGGVTGVSTISPGADVSIAALIGGGAGPDVYTGGTGPSPGDPAGAVSMMPMTLDSQNGDAEPVIGIIDVAMVPITNSALGLTGEVSTSSTGESAAMLGIGGDYDYSQAELAMLPAYAFASDAPGDPLAGFSTAYLEFKFTMLASGNDGRPNSAYLRTGNAMKLTGYGGGQAAGVVPTMVLTGSVSGEGIGQMRGEIGYA